jgi:hypothetical protein
MSKTDSGDDQPKQIQIPWRWIWIALALVLVGAAVYYLEQRSAAFRDVDTLQAMVKEIGGRYVEVDRDFAARMEAHRRDSPFGTFGPEQAIDPGIRSATRAWVAAAIGIIDDSLARRERIQNDTIAQIEASRATAKVKTSMLKAVRDAAIKAPLSVRIMNAMRAYLEKIGEMAAYLDLNAQGIALREGQLEFDDGAAGDRYNDYLRELAALERELQRLQQQARR